MPEKSQDTAPKKPAYDLFLSQIRVLAALLNGGSLSRFKLAEACGFSATSGTLSRILHGCPEGSSSGRARPGLITMGLVERVELDIDGLVEVSYLLTAEGERVVKERLAASPLPPLRSKERSTNKRYREEGQ